MIFHEPASCAAQSQDSLHPRADRVYYEKLPKCILKVRGERKEDDDEKVSRSEYDDRDGKEITSFLVLSEHGVDYTKTYPYDDSPTYGGETTTLKTCRFCSFSLSL